MKLSNNRLILAVLSVLCIIMIGVTTVRDEWLSPLRTAVGYFLMPVQSGVNRVGKSLYNNLRDREKLQTALDDNRRLQEQIDELVMENTRLQADSFELTRLRRLYELDQNYGQYHMVGARVIAKDTGGWFHIFRIDKGSADGIRPDMNVMAGGGLIGIVTDVGANYATVRSIIDDVSRVSAMAMQSGDTCIVSGDLQLYSQGLLRISDITDTADIKDGDKIVTSTVSSKYLPGILIGYAKDLRTDASRLTRSGTLIPAADFGTLQEVLVITELKSEFREHTEDDPVTDESAAGTEALTSGAADGTGNAGTGEAAADPDSAGAAEDGGNREEAGDGAAAAAEETEARETESSGTGDSGSSGRAAETSAAREIPEVRAETEAPAQTEESTDSVVIVERIPSSDPGNSSAAAGPGTGISSQEGDDDGGGGPRPPEPAGPGGGDGGNVENGGGQPGGAEGQQGGEPQGGAGQEDRGPGV